MDSFYGRRGVFITGGSGFIGKVVLEALVRRTPATAPIFVLLRPRKGKTARQRLEEDIVASPIWQWLEKAHGLGFKALLRRRLVRKCCVRRLCPGILVECGGRGDSSACLMCVFVCAWFCLCWMVQVPVQGDLLLPGLGVSTQDMQCMRDTVGVVIHAAATVDFNPPLLDALAANVHGALHALEVRARCCVVWHTWILGGWWLISSGVDIDAGLAAISSSGCLHPCLHCLCECWAAVRLTCGGKPVGPPF